jgi:hypothetical protein
MSKKPVAIPILDILLQQFNFGRIVKITDEFYFTASMLK